MKEKMDLVKIVQQAKEIGCFDISDYPGLSLGLDEFKELLTLLKKKNIPNSTMAKEHNIDKKKAYNIINSLRKGIPPRESINLFTVGRKELKEKFRNDLRNIGNASSRVHFMNAGYGYGKTHSLYILRDIAFEMGFVVSIVTLKKNSCPIHDFLSVYNRIMWELRTTEEKEKPAIEKILDRWLDTVRIMGEDKAIDVIKKIPDDLKNALHAYYESISPVSPSEEARQFILKYISGQKTYLRELRSIGVARRIDSSNALDMLENMALLLKNLNYRGICILFDEADPIHSFESYVRQDKAYGNLFEIIEKSRNTPNCFFLYATTPSFFDNYTNYWTNKQISSNNVIELDKLNNDELHQLANKICKIYSEAKNHIIPKKTRSAIERSIQIPEFSDTLGNFIRRCIVILDESAS